MVGVEVDMVVTDSLAALALYEQLFEVERLEVSAFPKGLNEAVFTLFGTRFHLLDENPEYQMTAPKPGDTKPMWLNVVVPDIKETYEKAISLACTVIQPIVEMEAMGVKNAVIADPFGHLWMLHQIDRIVSYEERVKLFEQERKEE